VRYGDLIPARPTPKTFEAIQKLAIAPNSPPSRVS
jgi:hypothetical protein